MSSKARGYGLAVVAAPTCPCHRLLAACPGSGALGACSILEALRVTTDANFRIEGMHCEGCAKTLEALLGAEPGVLRATVSLQAHEARVRFDRNAIDDGQIVAAIERAGYKVVIAVQ